MYGCLLPSPKAVGELHQNAIAVDSAVCFLRMGFLTILEEKPCQGNYCPLKIHSGYKNEDKATMLN
jgi:hypothetical protein